MRWPKWLGVGERRWTRSPNEDVQPAKTAWDLLQLLIVPAMLAALALWFNGSQASRERAREDRRIREDRAIALDARRDATLDAYLSEMSNLILNRNLLRAPPLGAVNHVARTATLTTARRLDGRRRGELVRFLVEAGLLRQIRVTGADVVLDLSGADLRNADLSDAHLGSISLHRVDLRGARFDSSLLLDVDLGGADLRGASFREAVIFRFTKFNGSDLTRSVFDHSVIAAQGADTFRGACLNHASFVDVAFSGQFGAKVSFDDAEGRGVDFTAARQMDEMSVKAARFTTVRLERAEGRPPGWTVDGPPSGAQRPAGADSCHPELP